MAQLKDSIVSGNLRVTDTTLTDTLQVTTIKAPTTSGGTTYGPGTSGQVLKSNGTTTYWASDSNSDTKVNVTLGTTTKAFLLGTSTTPTSTAQAVTSIADTGVYLGTTAGSLYATTFYENGTALSSKYAALSHSHDNLTSKALTASTFGSTSGNFFFKGGALFGGTDNADWVGIQGDASNDKFQLVAGGGNGVFFRESDDTWGEWHSLLTNNMISGSSGITVTQNTIKIGGDDGTTINAGVTISHTNSITAATSAVFKKIKYDAQGHITGTVDVSASDLPSHTHNYVPNTKDGVNAAINLLDTGSSTPVDGDYYISQFVGGGTTTTTYHRRPMSALASYVRTKLSVTSSESGPVVTGMSYSSSTGVLTYTKGRVLSTAGGQWISGRDNAPLLANSSSSTASGFYPMGAVKTNTGAWSIGALGSGDSFAFSFSTDTNYSGGVNTTNNYYIGTDGAFTGTAAGLTTKAVTASTVDTTPGTFAFSGTNLFGASYDWAGLQVDAGNDAFQLTANGQLLFRQNDSSTKTSDNWGDWRGCLTPANVVGSGGITVTQNDITIGSGDEAYSYKGAVTISHSNSITAQTSTVFKKFSYDANGHITGTANVAASDIPALNYVKTAPSVNYDINQAGFYAVMANKNTSNPNIDLPTANQWWHVLSMSWAGTSTDLNYWIGQLAIPTYQNKMNGLYWRTNSASNTALTEDDWKRVYCEEKITPTTQTTRTRNILHLYGSTVGNTASELVSGTAGVLSYGDAGPQINFSTVSTIGGAQDSAIIWTDHDTAATGASWHFVSSQSDWNVISKRFHARTGISIGTDLPKTSHNLYVNGTAFHSNTLTLGSESGNSPALVFQHGTTTDSLLDWRMMAVGNDLKLYSSTSGSTESWSNILTLGGIGVQINKKIGGLWVSDYKNTSYPMIRDNGENLWIGTMSTSSYHHNGGTYISTGWATTDTLPTAASQTLYGNETIKICVPRYSTNASGTGSWNGVNYNAIHDGPQLTNTRYLINSSTAMPPIHRAMFPNMRSNKLSFIPAADVVVEYSTNNGSTWTNMGVDVSGTNNAISDAMKAQLTTGRWDCNIPVGPNSTSVARTTSMQTRITFTFTDRDCVIDQIYMQVNSGYHRFQYTVQYAETSSPSDSDWTDWKTNFTVAAWIYEDTINGKPIRIGKTVKKLRFIFKQTYVDASYNKTLSTIKDIAAYGGQGSWTSPNEMVGYDHLYSWDYDQNATFPNTIYGKRMIATDSYLPSGMDHAQLDNNALVFQSSNGTDWHSGITWTNERGLEINSLGVVGQSVSSQYLWLGGFYDNPEIKITSTEIFAYSNLVLHNPASDGGASPVLEFRRGASGDQYSDWQIYDAGGDLCFKKISSTGGSLKFIMSESNGVFGSSDVVYENSAGFVNKTGMALWSYAKYLKVFVKDFSTNTYAIHDVAIESGYTCAISQHATIGQYGLGIQITPLQFTMSVSSGKWSISLTSGSCVAVNSSQTPSGSSSSIKMVKIIQCC